MDEKDTLIRQQLDFIQMALMPAVVLKQGPTLRDQFAMAALTGLLANAGWNAERQLIAQSAYEFADAVVLAREAE